MSKRPKNDQKQLFINLSQELHELVSNKHDFKNALNSFLNNLVDDMVLGIIFDLHRKYKTNAYELDDSQDEEENKDIDIFAQHNMKKTQECMCPNCERPVAASRFAPHLEKCMGMGRTRSRNASRRVTTNHKERDGTSYSGITSDDDDDADWGSGDKRRKKKARNGNKKSKGTPKKNLDSDHAEPLNVDIEGDDDELNSLRDILHLQDHSNSSSPAESLSSSHSSSSKKSSK